MRKSFCNICNNKGSALIITIMIVMILTIVMIYLLEKIVPAARNVKGIENSNIAYYNGDAAQEQAFLYLRTSTPGTETGVVKSSNQSIGYDMKITASGNIIPASGEGNSHFDADWNMISPGEPIQFFINDNVNWAETKFYFKVPNIKNGVTISLSGGTMPIINWSLTGSGKTMFASGSQIMALNNEIFNSMSSGSLTPSLHNRAGLDLDDIGGTLADFYNGTSAFIGNVGLGPNGSVCSSYNCVLKFSIVNDLVSTNGEMIPYLEYKIDMGANASIPLQYAIIKTDGYSYGFKKSIKREKLQNMSDAVWDFTVFQ